MDRISRVSAAMTGVKCPGCGKHVVPTFVRPDSSEDTPRPEPADTTPGKRWSFVWRPPSGMVCPDCSFPMERYARRLKWIRILRASVAFLVVGVVLLLTNQFTQLPSWLVFVYRTIGVVGVAGFVAGAIGMVVGGRSGDAG